MVPVTLPSGVVVLGYRCEKPAASSAVRPMIPARAQCMTGMFVENSSVPIELWPMPRVCPISCAATSGKPVPE
jgi:hypothetical protein